MPEVLPLLPTRRAVPGPAGVAAPVEVAAAPRTATG